VLYRKAITAFLMFIFFWTWPVRFLTRKNNCYFWTLEQLIRHGGQAKWYPSKRWAGYHVIWISPEGEEWEYTVPRMARNTPWWKLLYYDGTVRKFRTFRKDQ
jgi:hypothetical protein